MGSVVPFLIPDVNNISEVRKKESLDLLLDLSPAFRDPFPPPDKCTIAFLLNGRKGNEAEQFPCETIFRSHRDNPIRSGRRGIATQDT